MRVLSALCLILFSGLLFGCTSAEERRAAAEADLAEQRAQAAKDYRDCVKRYEGKPQDSDPCARFKEAAQTLAK